MCDRHALDNLPLNAEQCMFQVHLIFALKYWQKCCPPGIHQGSKIVLYTDTQGDFKNLQLCMCTHEDIKKWYSFITLHMNMHVDL